MRLRSLALPLLCLAAVLMPSPLRGQAQEAPPAPPKPGAEMAKLQPFAGTWKVEEIVEPSAMGPGGKGFGTAHVTKGPGGFSLHISYTSESPKGPMPGYKGEGYLAWDTEAKTYKQIWVDNMAPMLMVSAGHWEGEVFVTVTEGTMMGKAFKSVDRFTGISPNGYTITTEMSMDGGPMKKFMTLVHTKK